MVVGRRDSARGERRGSLFGLSGSVLVVVVVVSV